MIKSPLTALAPAKDRIKGIYPDKPKTREYPELFPEESRTISGKVVDLKKAEELYHRTTPGNAVNIIESGVVKAFETQNGDIDVKDQGVRTSKISLSASPANTYGGAVRLVWDHSTKEAGHKPYQHSIEAKLEPVIYYDPNETDTLAIENYRTNHLGTENINEVRAQMGISPTTYISEAEVMAHGNIETPPKRVEIWLMRRITKFNCSCDNTSNTYVDWSGYGSNQDNFYKFLDYFVELDQAVKDNLGGKLEMRSCYELVNVGYGGSGSKGPVHIIFETTPEALKHFREAIYAYYSSEKDSIYERFDEKGIREAMHDYTDIEEPPDPEERSEMARPLQFKCKC